MRVKAPPPAVALVGARFVVAGRGLANVMVPPVPVNIAAVPSAYAPSEFVIGTESKVLLVPEASVAVTTATTPLPIVLESMLDVRHVTEPVLGAQLSVLLAAVSTGPGVILNDVISLGGYDRVQARLAGAPPVGAFMERFSETVPPFTADPEARLKEVCAQAEPIANVKKGRRPIRCRTGMVKARILRVF